MSDKEIVAQVFLDYGETLVKKKNKLKIEPNYYRIGNGTMNKHKIQSIDLIDRIIEMSRPAQRVIKMIKDKMVYEPLTEQIEFIAHIRLDTQAEKQMWKKGFKELKKEDLVRRVKRSHYMINPRAMITQYDVQLKVWDTLVDE